MAKFKKLLHPNDLLINCNSLMQSHIGIFFRNSFFKKLDILPTSLTFSKIIFVESFEILVKQSNETNRNFLLPIHFIEIVWKLGEKVNIDSYNHCFWKSFACKRLDIFRFQSQLLWKWFSLGISNYENIFLWQNCYL